MKTYPHVLHIPFNGVSLGRGRLFFVAVSIVFFVAASAARGAGNDGPGEGWHGFRGNRRDAVSGTEGLFSEWPAGGPEEAWTASGIGGGYSSAVIAEKSIYITGDVGDELIISALSLDGELKWQVANGKAWKNPYPGSRASCVYREGRLYHMNAHGRVACLDPGDGSEIWSVDVLERFDAENIRWGISENLLLVGDQVIVSPGGPVASVAGLDRYTGETIWTGQPILFRRSVGFGGKAADPDEVVADKAGYASPMLLETGGRRLIVGCSARHFFCVDAETGKLAWKQTVPAKFEVIGSIPVIFGNRVFFVAPGEYGGECFRAYADAEEVRFESLWRTEVDSCHGALLHVDGKLYGSGYRRFKPWVCLDGKTGRMLYSKEDIAIGSCLFAEGRLYALEQEGRMFLLEPTDTAFAVRGEFQFVERPKRRDLWAHPVVYDGKLYLRYYDTLHCFDVRRKE